MRRIRLNLTTIEDMAAYALFTSLSELFEIFRSLINEGYEIVLYRSFSDSSEENQEILATITELNAFITRFIPK